MCLLDGGYAVQFQTSAIQQIAPCSISF